MRKKYMVIAGVLSVAVVAGWVLQDRLFPGRVDTFLGKTTGQPVAPVPAYAPAVLPAETATDQNASTSQPAWMNGTGSASASNPRTATSSPGSVTGASPEEAAKAVRMRAAMDRLNKLQSQKDLDPKAVEDALAEIERANGSSVMQGVRLDVLRENLRVAARMKKASEELQVLQQRSTAGELNPAQQAELNKKLADLSALQREMRTDFMASTPSTAR
jgi:hypothetical protein